MTWPTRMMAALLRWSAGLLPADRRVWVRALRAEADEVPAGWRRLAWLAGGVRLTAREAALSRRLGYLLAFATAAAGTAWSAWSGPPGDSAIVINRVDVITMAVILAGLPWAIRRTRGPVAGSRLARLVAEPGGAAAVAAWLYHRDELPGATTPVAVLSGGNIDPKLLASILAPDSGGGSDSG